MLWKGLITLIESCSPKTVSKAGRPPYPMETMLRSHLILQRYDLIEPAMKDALIEVPTLRRFAGIDLISRRTPVALLLLVQEQKSCSHSGG